MILQVVKLSDKRDWYECQDIFTVAILRGGWVGHGPPRFLLGPPFDPPVFFLIFRFNPFTTKRFFSIIYFISF